MSGRDAALQRLTQRLNELTDLLSLEQKTSADLRLNLSQLSSQLQAATAERDALTTRVARADDATAKANRSAGDLEGKLAAAQQDVAQRDAKLAEAQSTVDQLNQQLLALREQLAQIAAALDASEAKSKDQQVQIADLGKRLNAALASKVEELARYRSEFFGRLREVLGDRPDIRVVGDRFVFQSEVLFSPGKRRSQRWRQAAASARGAGAQGYLLEDPDRPQLGAAGRRPHRQAADHHARNSRRTGSCRARAPSRWCASSSIRVFRPNRLVAAGFGEYQPIDTRDSEDAYRRNRRIELKLTER